MKVYFGKSFGRNFTNLTGAPKKGNKTTTMIVYDEAKDFLKKVPPFQFLDEETLYGIIPYLRLEFYSKGTVILEEGGKSSEFLYLIKKGAVKVTFILRPRRSEPLPSSTLLKPFTASRMPKRLPGSRTGKRPVWWLGWTRTVTVRCNMGRASLSRGSRSSLRMKTGIS